MPLGLQPSTPLSLVPFDLPGRDGMLAWLVPQLERALGVAIDVRTDGPDAESPPRILYEECYDPVRGQYNAHLLLENLETVSDNGLVLGITGVDLFAPVFKHVMGEALLSGRSAVISTYRLAEELYGLPPNPALERDRLLKEAIHELGHCRGLVHCFELECPMRAASSVEDVDLRGLELCPSCRQSLSRG